MFAFGMGERERERGGGQSDKNSLGIFESLSVRYSPI